MPVPAGRWLAAGLLLAASLATRAAAPTDDWNGFDLTGLAVPKAGLANGGQPRDGIPALSAPKFKPANEVGMGFEERVVGVVVDGVARAYPRSVLIWHEVVNDRIGEQPFVLVYSPLSGTVAALRRQIRPRAPTGSACPGLLYNSGTVAVRPRQRIAVAAAGRTGHRRPAQGRAADRHRRDRNQLGRLAHALPETAGADAPTPAISARTARIPTPTTLPTASCAFRWPRAATATTPRSRCWSSAAMVTTAPIRSSNWPRHDQAFTDEFAGATYRIDFNYADQRALVTRRRRQAGADRNRILVRLARRASDRPGIQRPDKRLGAALNRPHPVAWLSNV